MKKILFILGCLVVMLNLCSYAQSTYDGKEWILLNRYIEGRTMRKVLIQGICEGAEVMQGERARQIYYIGNYEQLALIIDEFYNDEKNLSIPVTHALFIASMKLKNKPKSEIDEAIKKFREGYRMQFMKEENKSEK
ncbi:MAG: hypothetical protein M0R48_06340 [Candidatus Omnitrophica bacterium]|jgi:hypothetical protein|nr:hypothetical protein [Candidatus Omnitrophota bacterium]